MTYVVRNGKLQKKLVNDPVGYAGDMATLAGQGIARKKMGPVFGAMSNAEAKQAKKKKKNAVFGALSDKEAKKLMK